MDAEDFFASLKPFTAFTILGTFTIGVINNLKLIHPAYQILYCNKTLLQPWRYITSFIFAEKLSFNLLFRLFFM